MHTAATFWPAGYGKDGRPSRYSLGGMPLVPPQFRFCPLCRDELISLASGPDRGRMGCQHGHFVYYDNPAITAFAFVERSGRYLVLQRAQDPYRGRWELPGGFVESRETPAEAVMREIFEETGLHIEAATIIGAYVSRYGDEGKWTVDVAFHCLASQSGFNLSAESSEAAWVPLEQMPPLAFAGERSALVEFKQKLNLK